VNPIVVPDPFALANEDVSTEQGRIRNAVELQSVAAVMLFEREKHAVNRDHVHMQARIWGRREGENYPVELPTTGA